MSRLPRILFSLGFTALVTLALGAAASPASAQYYGAPRGTPYYPPPPPRMGVYREGLTIGGGIGIGAMTADACGDYCGGGLALEFHVGGMLTPQFALMFDAFPIFHPVNSDVEAVNTQYTIAAQVFPTDQFWLKGGVGIAHYSETSQSIGGLGSDSGTALTLAAGFEIYQSGPFAIDLQLRFGESFYSNAKDHGVGALLVGFNWY